MGKRGERRKGEGRWRKNSGEGCVMGIGDIDDPA